MKKIIVGILSFVFLFVGHNAFASATTWNTASNDCSDIAIANYTTNNGYGSPCWTGTNINANPGDTINVRVYYHNTGSATATNTRIKVFAPTGSSTNHSFSAQILSPEGNLYSGNVSVNIPTSQTLTYTTTKWFPNQTTSAATLLNGQSGVEILGTNGLNIGNIAPGWATQGTVVVAFKVGNTQPQNCSIDSFTANPTSINQGSSSTLNWNTTDCASVKLDNNSVSLDGSQAVSPATTTTYTLKAYNSSGTLVDTRSVTVTVNQVTPNCTINSFTANPTSITSGSSSVLNWNTSNCTNVTISNLGYNVPVSGSQSVWPTVTTTYVLTATGSNGVTQTRSVTVTVNQVTPNCTINSFTANPTSINQGSSSTLNWKTSNCTSVSINGADVQTSGSRTVTPTVTTTYVLTATGSNGVTQTRSVTVTVNQVTLNCTINSFTANPSSIINGDSSTLTWDTSNCDTITIDGVSVSNPSGSKVVWPTSTKTYTLSASKSFGTAPVTAKTTVYVNDDNNTCDIVSFSATDTSIEDGDSTTLKWNTNGCDYVKITDLGTVSDDGSETVSPSEDTTYVLTAYDFNGSHQTASVRIYVDSNSNNNNDCSIDSYTASDTYINKGDDVTLRWRTTGCDDVRISSIGTVSDDGSETVSPYSTTTYLLKAYGDGGSDSESIKVNVDYNNNDDVVYNTNVITTIATNISQTGAQLNGLITNTNYNSYNNTNTYFSYGTNVNLGMRTPSRSVGGNTNFSDYITNLAPNTIYYFRAIAEGPNGVSYGAIEVFRTLGYTNNYNYTDNTTVRTVRQVVYQQGTTVLPSASPIMLQIGNKYQMIGTGDMVEYTVYYKNISSSTLTNPMVQVYVPKGITITNTSRGTYSVEDRILSVPIENLNPGDEGYIYLQAKVDSLDMNSAQIVTTAILIYTNPNGAQENAMAYVLNNPRGGNNLLGASAFFGGMIGMSLIGWLILIIIIMLLILLSRSYYGRKSVTTTVTHQ